VIQQNHDGLSASVLHLQHKRSRVAGGMVVLPNFRRITA